jgi:hypothetical protein
MRAGLEGGAGRESGGGSAPGPDARPPRPAAPRRRELGWPQLGRAHDAWPGITIAGIVIVAAAVLADAFGDPPRGGPRLVVGLAIGFVTLAVGYVLRWFERRQP